MTLIKKLCTVLLLVISSYILVECRSYNNGLIFYNLENHNTYLPPTISVSRGRGLSKFKYSSRGSIWSTFGKPCECENSLCACCVGIKVKQYKFDQKICANVSYFVPKDEIQLEVFLNNTATAKYGLAARNPSPLCVPIMMGIPMSMCIQMSNIGVQGDNLNMCMDFLVRLASTELFEMHFQCMKVGLQGASWVGADGQPVIPAGGAKIKDKNSYESDEYYDENEVEQENVINSNDKEEENIVTIIQKEESNQAEELMDNNDITETVMDIVKETEEGIQSDEENKVQGISATLDHLQVEEIVTNIMDSINESNVEDKEMDVVKSASKIKVDQGSPASDELEKAEEENLYSLEPEENDLENMEHHAEANTLKEIKPDMEKINNNKIQENIKGHFHDNNEILEEMESLKDINIDKNPSTTIQNNEISEGGENSKDLPNSIEQVEFDLEELPEMMDIISTAPSRTGSEKPINIEKNQQSELHNNKPEEELEEAASHIAAIAHENVEMLINTTDKKATNDLKDSLEMLQQTMKNATGEPLIAANVEPTIPHNVLPTSEIDNTSTKVNGITTATTTISTTTTTANIPVKLDEKISVPIAPTKCTDGSVNDNNNNNNNNDDQDEGSDDDDDDSDDDDDDDDDDDSRSKEGDNSQENYSDYENEESEETANESAEKEIESNNDSAVNVFTMPLQFNNENVNSHRQTSSTTQLANESNDSASSNETNDELEIEEEAEVEETADEKDHNDMNEPNRNAAEEEYSGDYEQNKKTHNKDDNKTFSNSHFNNNNKEELPQIDTSSGNKLSLDSNGNPVISNLDDGNVLNINAAHSKLSEIMANSSAAAISSSNVMPLPLARKLSALHHQQQKQQQQQQQKQQKQHRRL